jgi:cell division septum initiation protein DivIVA
MRLLISLILALGVVTIAAACGGSGETSREDYEQEVQDARNEVEKALQNLGQGVESREELADRLANAALVVERVADDLDETGAPKDLSDENERLVKNLRELAGAVSGTAEQFRDPSFTDVFSHTRALQWDSWTRANRILRELRRQGIDVEPWA